MKWHIHHGLEVTTIAYLQIRVEIRNVLHGQVLMKVSAGFRFDVGFIFNIDYPIIVLFIYFDFRIRFLVLQSLFQSHLRWFRF